MELESRIRELCAKAVTAERQELNDILLELRSAIREHIKQVRAMAQAEFTGKLQSLSSQLAKAEDSEGLRSRI